MKRILIVGNNDIGLYNFRKELIQKLIEEGHEVYFSVPWGEKVELIKELGAIYYPVPINRRSINPFQEIALLAKYNRMLSKIRPEVVLTYTIKPNLYVGFLARVKKIPYITTITGLGTMFQSSGTKRKLVSKAYRIATVRARAVFFQNAANREIFVNEGIVEVERTILVNGSGVNTDEFKPFRKEHEGINFLFIGRIMREKGIVEYLEAAAMIKRDYEEANFLIVGQYEEQDLREKVEDYHKKGIVKYLGVSNDTRKEMTIADCIVLPSYHEGMSNVLLEGAAFGLPLIASDIPGCREIVQKNVSGFLNEARNSSNLESTVREFIMLSSSKRKSMGEAGRDFVESKFDRKKVVENYVNIVHLS